MNRAVRSILLRSAVLSIAFIPAFTGTGAAQETIVPVPDPVTGTAPAASGDAQETHDEVSIQQLMKVVDLSRLVAGGISQLFSAAQGQKQLLDLIRGAQIGPKEFPVLNGPEEIEARGGGDGLKEMADGAMNGAVEGPPDLVEALNQFRTTFDLGKAFELRNDELFSKKILAQFAAKGAVAGASAEAAYKRANASNGRLNDYITALEDSPDLKTSIDINTRVMIELTQQSNESIRTQSATTSLLSAYFMALASEASDKDWIDGLKDFNR
ncbi:type IV secretion system protein [Rhizobium sp. BT-226]|uniref:type IV secretion system protein n=1 Tax=Rhizobium sp. BT-226 TaxID=2986922 RepID=UPI0021F75FA8|nr:type IV secretion system protein [Rhizobium sp. BT-226]MCW0021357.1 hypothetical protein [Rhizobium sp. BT-226]